MQKISTIAKMSKRLEKYFFRDDNTMANNHMIVGEMPIKTTMDYHCISIRIVTIRKTENSKC